MMSLPSYRDHPRRYARRLPPGYARVTTLTVRLTPAMKDAVAYMAACKQISMSEYAARIINDHLTAAWVAFD